MTVIKGTAPTTQVLIDPATNRIVGGNYDANGNDVSQGSYDVANRFIQAGQVLYGYAPNGKRVWKSPDGIAAHEEFYIWSPQGQRLGTYTSTSPGYAAFTTASTNVYLGGRLIQAQGTTVLMDRLGSNVTGGRRYYPYGQERNATTNNLEKFTGYFRDAETGLDYADQRYHQPGMGRFTTPDSSLGGTRLRDPGSWNRYTYVQGDPINFNDPRGLTRCDVNGDNCYDSVTVNGDTGQAVWSDVPNGYAAQAYDFIDARTWGDPPPAYQGAALALSYQMSSQFEQGCAWGQTRMANGSCDVALNPAAQNVIDLVNQMNPSGFVNAFAVSMLGAAAAGNIALALTDAGVIIAGSNNTIVLGSFLDRYINPGGVVGADVLSIPKPVWDAMTAAERWAVNQAFLDAAIARNATIAFTSDPSIAPGISGLGQEYQYLKDQGYQMVTDIYGGIKMIYWPQNIP